MKILLVQKLVIVILAGIALSVVLLFYFVHKSSVQRDTALPPEQEATSDGLPDSPIGKPVRLKIPTIAVDATVEYVGLTADGAMDVPKNQDDVVWYELGQRPGEHGSAVIAGHYGVWKKTGRGSVFDQLHTLRQGDKIEVEDDAGITTTFVVRESRSYDPAADAADVFRSDDGKSHLNLVTCAGVWNEREQSYSKRLVVFTDKE